MSDSEIYLRKVISKDINICFDWINEDEVKGKNLDSDAVVYDENIAWSEYMMNDINQIQYILMNKNEPIGHVLLSINGENAEIAYSITNVARRYSLGMMLIELVKEQVKSEYPFVQKLKGRVKQSNIVSLYCFQRNGFVDKNQLLECDLTKKNIAIQPKCEIHNWEYKLLFLTNNRNAISLFKWISERCDATLFSDRLSVEVLQEISPDIVISYNYNYLISQECIDAVHENIINMHISLLPWNRGSSPNIWSFIDGTPKGVTIHMLSAGLDEGDVLLQKELEFDISNETFETTYYKLNEAIVELFKNNWDIFCCGEFKKLRKCQTGNGTYHTIRDLEKLKAEVPFEWFDNIEEFLNRYKKVRRG